MKRSTERILTTHTGSLPRPDDLTPLLRAKDAGESTDQAALDRRVREAVDEVVRRQAEAGIDVLNDGEMGKIGYSTYVKDRLTGFEGEETARMPRGEARDFPEWAAKALFAFDYRRPMCNGPIAWKNFAEVQRDIDNLRAATQGLNQEEVFMTAASPGVVAHFLGDSYYGSEEKFVYALADVMKDEYDAIHRAGFILQLDCPDLAMSRHGRFVDLSDEEFLKMATLHVEALNHATRDIPSDRMRLHLCWGNYEGPHHMDIPLSAILPVALTSRCGAVSFEGANPRHEHEWKVFQDVKLPDGYVVIPGVLDSTTNFVEHPELVAQRLVRYANVVGKENVIAGTDCGFGTFARTNPTVDPKIAWAKLQAMAEGARLASKQLW
jgi:5-methyltetrahydropteroyltriglutamate--homocysteine methyltransferase